jgi:hypothetical protein
MSNITKLEEPFQALPSSQSQSFKDHHSSHTQSSERSSSSRALPAPAAPINTAAAADHAHALDFWDSPFDSHASFAQADSGPQWTPISHHGSVASTDGLRNNTIYPDSNAFIHSPSLSHFQPTLNLDTNAATASYELPPRDVTYRLISHYTRTVHDWIPLVPTALLDREVDLYYAAPFQVNNTRLAILHLVLAIGARHAYLTDRSVARQREDIQHFTRAVRLLAVIDPAGVTATPDVALVQCYGLLSLYYLTVHQADRYILLPFPYPPTLPYPALSTSTNIHITEPTSLSGMPSAPPSSSPYT